MKAVLLAAGEGKRIREYTEGKAKEMIPFYGKPFLEYILQKLKAAGLREIIIVINPRKKIVENYFKDGKNLGLKIRYVMQGKQMGTASAILAAGKLLSYDKYFLVHYGDSLTNVNMPKIILANFRKCKNLDAYLVLRPTKIVSRYGIVKFGRGGRIVDIIEKPRPENAPSNKAVLGFFIMKKESFFNSVKNEKFVYGKESFPPAYITRSGGNVKGWVFSRARVDLGKYYDIKKSHDLIKKYWKDNSIKAIVFDADNTLYETRKIAKFAYAAAMQVLAKETGKNRKSLLKDFKKIIKFLRTSSNPMHRTFQYSFEFMAAKYRTRKSVVKKMLAAFENEIINRLKRKKGTKRMFRALKKEGIKIIVATEEPQKNYLLKKLQATHLRRFVNLVVSSSDTREMKPSKKFYEIIRKRTGLRYDQMMAIGDDYKKDLEVPEKLGMKTMLVSEKPIKGMHVVKIRDFTEFFKEFDFYLYLKTKKVFE